MSMASDCPSLQPLSGRHPTQPPDPAPGALWDYSTFKEALEQGMLLQAVKQSPEADSVLTTETKPPTLQG